MEININKCLTQIGLIFKLSIKVCTSTPLANWVFDEGQPKEAPAEAEQAARREQTDMRQHYLAQHGLFRHTPVRRIARKEVVSKDILTIFFSLSFLES